MKYYPIHISIVDRPCLVVGGGKVALRKVSKLIKAGAAVTVISKELTPELKELKDKGVFIHRDRHYQKDDVKDFFMVFAATNDQCVNGLITEEAKHYGVLANSINGVDEGDFILPASCQVGDLHLGITTQGQSPALSAALRRYFIKKLSALTPELIDEVALKRKQMLNSNNKDSEREMMEMVDEIIERIENNKIDLNTNK